MQTSRITRVIATGLVFVAGMSVFGVLIFSFLSHLFRCPPEHPACDMPDMAAFGLACIGSPLVSLLAAWYAWRRLRPSVPAENL
jgi:hypothetical protein